MLSNRTRVAKLGGGVELPRGDVSIVGVSFCNLWGEQSFPVCFLATRKLSIRFGDSFFALGFASSDKVRLRVIAIGCCYIPDFPVDVSRSRVVLQKKPPATSS